MLVKINASWVCGGEWRVPTASSDQSDESAARSWLLPAMFAALASTVAG